MAAREGRNPSRRGLLVWGILGAACLGATATAIAVWAPRTTQPSAMTDRDRLARAREAFSCQSFLRAEEFLQPLVNDGRGSLEERLFYGKVLLELGRLTKARDLLNALHKERPDSADVVAGLGEVHEKSGQIDLAISCYKRAGEMNKTDARIFRLLGLAQESKGDRMAALFSFRQSLKLLPGQEDLSQRMNEIGAARQARADPSQARRNPSGFDPFGDFDPRPPDPREIRPGMRIPDPFDHMPRPGGRTR